MTQEQPVIVSSEIRILLFSDDSVSARMLKQILSHRSYRVHEVSKISLVQAAITRHPPALILLDVITPGEDIYALCQDLKANRATRLIPVLFVSAFQQITDKVRAFAVGGDDYLIKPFHPAEVLARVDHHLGVARLQQELAQEKLALERSYEQLRAAHQRISLMTGVLSEHLTGMLLDGKYLLEGKLDSGGYGIVYRAKQVTLQRQVAVKVLRLLHPSMADSQLERFRREGISTCRIAHPNAVTVLDSGISPEGIPYLVMELLTGVTLAVHLLQCAGVLPIAECLRIIEPICEVLIEAHAAGVIHRDIKPENIFLHNVPTGVIVKVLDFGIAILQDENTRALTSVTSVGATPGTELFMAPERLYGGRTDGRSDVYSVSVMLYMMLCGVTPFRGQLVDVMQTLDSHLHEQPVPLHQQSPTIPAELANVVMSGLARDPKLRPDARDYLAQLRAAKSS